MKLDDLDYAFATQIDDEPGGDGKTNRANALLAEYVLRQYGQLAGITDEDASEVAADLLIDLMHLCRMNGLDFEIILNDGRTHFEAETEGLQ